MADDDTGVPDTGVPDAVVDELLATGPEEFVARRTAIVKRLRAAGDRATADAVAKLRKPARLVWRLDAAARADRGAVARLVTAAADARAAQAGGRGGDLRAATAAIRDAIGELAGGEPELAQTLRVLAGDEDALDALAQGRLLALPEVGGLGPLPERGDDTAARPGEPRRPDAAARRRAKDAVRGAEREVDAITRELDRTRKRLDELTRDVADREAELEAATEALDAARAELADLEA